MPINSFLYPGAKASPPAYEVANSCRFDKGSSPSLSKTSGTPTNALKWTFSAWVKISGIANDTFLLDFNTDTNNRSQIGFQDSDKAIIVYEKVSGSTSQLLQTSAQFRDPSAWLNIVVSCDRTLGTDTERTKIYVNGTRVTSFSTADGGPNYPAQNTNGIINTAVSTLIGKYSQSTLFYDGYMCEVVFIDGTAYAASDFGEFDEDSPTIWKPKDPSTLTFGNNGFYLDFEDSSNLGNDANGGTDFTETNIVAADQATDTCTNNFCTLNPLIRQIAEETGGLKEGNTEVLFSGASWGGVSSTMAPAAGKWYFEGKLIANGSNSIIGVVPANTQGKDNTGTWYIGQYSGEQAYQNNGAASNGGASFGNTYTDGDIIGVMLDCDNAKVYFSKNGSLENSGDPSSGSTGTGAMSLTAGEFYTPAVSGNGVTNWEMNFGNPPYANSSDAADGNGYGAFEYAPPSGYLAICTKNLGSDGG